MEYKNETPPELQFVATWAKQYLNFVENCARDALVRNDNKHMSAYSRLKLKNALDRISSVYSQLEFLLIDTIKESSPSRAAYGYQAMHLLIEDAFIIGSLAITSEETRKYVRDQQAAHARVKRSEKPEKLALKEAITHVRGDDPVAKPTKEAAAIIDPVNKRLESNGFASVKIDKIRRVLEKLPRC